MKISVLGATGPTGLQFVLEAIKNEHEVTALVRNPEGLSSVTNDKLKVCNTTVGLERVVFLILDCMWPVGESLF